MSKGETDVPLQEEVEHRSLKEEIEAGIGKRKRLSVAREPLNWRKVQLTSSFGVRHGWEAGQCCQGGVGGLGGSWEGRRLGKLICRGRGHQCPPGCSIVEKLVEKQKDKVCVCVRERGRERDRETAGREREKERARVLICAPLQILPRGCRTCEKIRLGMQMRLFSKLYIYYSSTVSPS